MNRAALALGFLAASLLAAPAQITVEVLLDQDQFLVGESLPVGARITNLSGQTLRLGAETDWLTFDIESARGSVVQKTGDVPVAGEFTLQSSRMATKRVDLAPYFTLTQPGRYFLTATVRITDWPRTIPPSKQKGFDVIEGAKLWEQEFGIPVPPGVTNATPEVRKYILQQANYLKGQIRLYLRLTDATGSKTFRVFPIGTLLSFSRPEFQVDKFSRLHVLYESGPHSFSYSVFSPDGSLLVKQSYDFKTTRSRLKVDDDGNISVMGGSRHVTPNDLPPPETTEGVDEAKPAKP
jgi:hypothetical protein